MNGLRLMTMVAGAALSTGFVSAAALAQQNELSQSECQAVWPSIQGAATAHPRNRAALEVLLSCSETLGKPASALAAAKVLLRMGDRTAAVHAAYATALDDQGAFRQALAHSRKALKLAPASPEALEASGRALQAFGHYDDAIANYRQVLDQDPHRAETMARLAEAYRQTHQFEDALRWSARALKIQPKLVHARITRGLSLEQFGRHAEAADEFATALLRDPDSILLHHDLSDACTLAHRYDDAIQVCQEGLRLAPHDDEFHKCLAVNYVAVGNKSGALEELETLRQLGSSYTSRASEAIANRWGAHQLALKS
ncbi:MAG TPA: tetratricopeptide repeat protein [Elusimicrobiota bacterium]|nr:tetratricopeptide repeat protein [Elusimicrobiota bacterium]